MTEEDRIIVDAMLKIKSGILSKDWLIICEAYEDISGEKIEVPENKSRLERIREAMAAKNENEYSDKSDNDDSENDISKMSVAKIKEYLIQSGHKEKSLKSLNKKKLIELIDKPIDEEPIIKNASVVDEINGGDKFGRGKIKIISDVFNPVESMINKKRSGQRNSVKIDRDKVVAKNFDNPKSEVRYIDNPPAPPWR